MSRNCPVGKLSCYNCVYNTSGGCTHYLQRQGSTQFSITVDDMKRMWQDRYNQLMSLPKEDLVKMIIGEKPYYCYI